jgi:hypothetical protein
LLQGYDEARLMQQHTNPRISPLGPLTAASRGDAGARSLPVPSVSRRALLGGLALAALWPWRDRAWADPEGSPRVIEFSPKNRRLLYDEVASKVIPATGYPSRIAFRDSVVRLVRHGVIDRGKFFALQRNGQTMTGDLAHVLSDPSERPIRLTRENAAAYVNVLWPIGLANRLAGNFSSPLSGSSVSDYASTAGWTLGEADEGGGYFNKFPIVDITPAQEALAIRVAKSTFRPCCDNATFFQDCNHGSALYGLLQLGASQGLQAPDLFREALAFNAFWFEQSYVRTALFFAVARGVAWRDVDPKEVMSEGYSSSSGWRRTVEPWIARNADLIPQSEDGTRCGV